MLARQEITYGHARAILGLESPAAQTKLAALVAKRGLSVRQVENLVAFQGAKPAAKAATKRQVDPNIRAAALELERTLGTRVKILGDGRRGKIEIAYFSGEDLSRLYELILRK